MSKRKSNTETPKSLGTKKTKLNPIPDEETKIILNGLNSGQIDTYLKNYTNFDQLLSKDARQIDKYLEKYEGFNQLPSKEKDDLKEWFTRKINELQEGVNRNDDLHHVDTFDEPEPYELNDWFEYELNERQEEEELHNEFDQLSSKEKYELDKWLEEDEFNGSPDKDSVTTKLRLRF